MLPRLAPGKRATYRIAETAGAAKGPPAVEARADDDGVWLTLAGKQVLFYRARGVAPRPDVKPELVRGGYIHPVLTPAGRTVTDDYPVDHKHHHGIWNAWTSTEYEGRKPDFWNMGSRKGRKDHVALAGTWRGEVAGGFSATLSSTDLGATPPKVVIDETWKVVLHRTHPGEEGRRPTTCSISRSTEKVVGSSPLTLLQYLYGGLALRGPGAWLGEQNARFLTSEGKSRTDGENTAARWYFLGGELEGKPVGIAVLGHPANFRAPQPVRIHPKEPYFSVAPPKAGRFVLEPGQAIRHALPLRRRRRPARPGAARSPVERLRPPARQATVDLPRGILRLACPRAAGTSPIVFAALTKRYGEFLAVDRLSLEVARGEVFGFLGPNGAGKTTTIRMLMGILVPTSGQAQVESWDCQRDRVEVARRVGYLPDNPIFYDYLRGREILEFVGEMHGLPRSEAVARAARPAGRPGAGRRGRRVRGQLLDRDEEEARALLRAHPRPARAGARRADQRPRPARRARGAGPHPRRSAADGKTVFLSTHLLDMAERLCHRVGIIDGGRLVAVGTVEQLRAAAAGGRLARGGLPQGDRHPRRARPSEQPAEAP